MHTAAASREIRLAARGIFEVPDAAGVEIGCAKGSLWVTLDNDPRDIVLEAGETFATGEHRRALVYAFRSSTVELRDAQHGAQASVLRRLEKNNSDCRRSPSVWAATRAAISG